MKRIIVSDIHLGWDNSNLESLKTAETLFKEIADYCVINNIRNIDILGDMFDNRKQMGLMTLHYANEIGKILNNFNTNIILGNHDAFFKNQATPNSLVIFKEKFQNINIIDEEIYVQDNIAFVPYFSSIQDIQEEVDYVFGHFDINGFLYNQSIVSSGCKLSISDFKKYKKVLSGHYHIRSNNSNIWYVGSPYQMNFGECNSTHGYHVFDDGELTFIEFSDYQKYKIIYYNNSIDYNQIKNNKVKIVFQKEISEKEINAFIEKVQLLEPARIVVDFSEIVLEKEEEIVDESNVEEFDEPSELFAKYLEYINIPEHLNKLLLIKMFDNMVNGNE